MDVESFKENGVGINVVPSSGQLESGKAHGRRCTADRPIHKTFFDMGVLGMNVHVTTQSQDKIGLDKVPSSGQLESEKAHNRRCTADRPNHEALLDMGLKSERS
ncbi:hypothetical protein HAX54_027022 [Datura stramonium]|uniref:Uncharacterized protein n=1 Tax=Datura stramonium TaxID=4076 RepID=A0ABS8V1V1_DATST|nr:hypothetical protein [Datura stramonium]